MQLPPVKQTSLASVLLPDQNATQEELDKWKAKHDQALKGRQLWEGIQDCILLDYSHRCGGELASILDDLVAKKKITDESWKALCARTLTHPTGTSARTGVRKQPFTEDLCPVGVLRHSIRASVSWERAQQFARTKWQRLLLPVAADRCVAQQSVLHVPGTLYRDVASVSNLTTTAHLANVLFLYTGMPVLFEEKLCVELGIVRGCPCQIVGIVCDAAEPPWEEDATLEPHILTYVPEALVLHVPNTWIKESILGPGKFYLPRNKRSWRFDLDSTYEEECNHDKEGKKYFAVERVQLPVANTIALTAYAMQGQTLPCLLLDLGKPPGMSRDDFWISILVMLSRVEDLGNLIIIRLPDRACFDGGPPTYLHAEYERLRGIESKTIRKLDAFLEQGGCVEARAAVTQPLLQGLLR